MRAALTARLKFDDESHIGWNPSDSKNRIGRENLYLRMRPKL